MKVLILGGHGMAGHMIRNYFRSETHHEVSYTVRRYVGQDPGAIILDVRNRDDVKRILEQTRPDIVINAVGLLNEAAAKYVVDAITVNSLLPHWLDEIGQDSRFRLIHISTDCVFSGQKGNYREYDTKDGTSVYAQTKSLGEIINRQHLTIRTSIIGPELRESGIGLFQWFMRQSGVVYGYRNVLWNGITTLQLAKALASILQSSVSGLVHLAALEPISKHELLRLMQQVFKQNNVEILPDNRVASNKTLLNTRADFSIPIPNYKQMLIDLKQWMNSPGG